MSMLSAQRDKLRWLADNLEEHDSHMNEYVQAMRSAADTIWQLRNDCVDSRLENKKLRELVRDMWRDIPKSNCDWSTEEGCCVGSDKCNGECSYFYRMRRLGIEVDE